jgi:cytidylate kinase
LPLSEITIAIDGPAGAGKSTVAKRVAKELGLKFLDTGAMYRALALKALRAGFTANDGEAVGQIGESTNIDFIPGDPQTILLDGEDVTGLIRTAEIGEAASALSAHTPVRRVLAERQKRIVAEGGYVLEGRDVTTVIAPEAEVKVFLTASLGERSRRRHAELVAKGDDVSLQQIESMIAERDHRDTNRQDSPLRKAENATEIISDGMAIDEVVEAIKQLARAASVTI